MARKMVIKTNEPFAETKKGAIPGAEYQYVRPKTENKTDVTGKTLITGGITSLPQKKSSRLQSRQGQAGRLPTQAEAESMTLLAKPYSPPAKYKPQKITPPKTQGGTTSRQGEPPWANVPQRQGEIRPPETEAERNARMSGYAELQRESYRNAPKEPFDIGKESMSWFGGTRTRTKTENEAFFGSGAGAVEAYQGFAPAFNPVDIAKGTLGLPMAVASYKSSGNALFDISRGFTSAEASISENPYRFAGMGVGFVASAPFVGKAFGKMKSLEIVDVPNPLRMTNAETRALSLERSAASIETKRTGISNFAEKSTTIFRKGAIRDLLPGFKSGKGSAGYAEASTMSYFTKLTPGKIIGKVDTSILESAKTKAGNVDTIIRFRPKEYSVDYLKGISEVETSTVVKTARGGNTPNVFVWKEGGLERVPGGAIIKEETLWGKGKPPYEVKRTVMKLPDTYAWNEKPKTYIKSMDTRSLNNLMKEGYPFDTSADIYKNVFRETNKPGLQNYAYEFGFGTGKSAGTMKRIAFNVETKIETVKPKVPGLIDMAVMEKSRFIGGKFEGMNFRQARTSRTSFPVSFEEDTFKVQRFRGKPSGKTYEFMDTSENVKPDFFKDVLQKPDYGNFNFGRPGGVVGPALERPERMPLSFAWKAPISAEELKGGYDFFPSVSLGQKRPNLSTGGMDMKTMNVFTPAKAGRTETRLGIDILGKQNLKPSFNISERSHGRTRTGLNVKDILNVGSGISRGSASRNNQRQNVFSNQKFQSMQRQEQKVGLRTRTYKSPKFGFGLMPSRSRNVFSSSKARTPKFSFGFKAHGRTFTKAFYSDLLSVNYSAMKFGKFTHPALTKANWAKAESTGFLNVPTVEMGKRKLRRLI